MSRNLRIALLGAILSPALIAGDTGERAERIADTIGRADAAARSLARAGETLGEAADHVSGWFGDAVEFAPTQSGFRFTQLKPGSSLPTSRPMPVVLAKNGKLSLDGVDLGAPESDGKLVRWKKGPLHFLTAHTAGAPLKNLMVTDAAGRVTYGHLLPQENAPTTLDAPTNPPGVPAAPSPAKRAPERVSAVEKSAMAPAEAYAQSLRAVALCGLKLRGADDSARVIFAETPAGSPLNIVVLPAGSAAELRISAETATSLALFSRTLKSLPAATPAASTARPEATRGQKSD